MTYRRIAPFILPIIPAIISGCMVATEFAAWRFGWAVQLGSAWQFNHIHLYWPWRIVEWHMTWPGAEIINVAIRVGFVAAVALFGLSLFSHASKHKKHVFGADSWGNAKDAKDAGIMADTPRGTVLGQWHDGRLLSYNGDEHQLVAGAAGSGKTVGPAISSLLTWPHSALVYDPKQELYAHTGAYRSKLGTVFYFDPTCPGSACYNPLSEIRRQPEHETGDVQNLVSILIDPGGSKNALDYWDSDAAKMLTALILYTLYDRPEEERNLSCVNDLLLNIKNTIPYMQMSINRRCRMIAEYIDELPEKQLAGVYGTASTSLILFDDPLVSEKTSRSDFRISDLVCSDTPVTCYLQVRPTDEKRLRPLSRLILTQIAQALMYDIDKAADGRKKKHRMLYLLEEFPSLGRLDFFSSQLRVMRGYGNTALLIVQSFKDIISAYGRDQTIVDNCRIVVCFAASDPETLRMVSTMVGSAIEHKESITKPRFGWGFKDGSRTFNEQRRSLLDPGEVRQLAYDEQLVLVTGSKPFRTKKVRWFAHPMLSKLGTNLRKQ